MMKKILSYETPAPQPPPCPEATPAIVVEGATIDGVVDVAIAELDSFRTERPTKKLQQNTHSDLQLLRTTLSRGCNWYK